MENLLCTVCGGRVDPASGKCERCGARSEVTRYVSMNDFDDLVRQYGLSSEDEPDDLPGLFDGDYFSSDAAQLFYGAPDEEKTAPPPPDGQAEDDIEKAASVRFDLSSYMKRLEVTANKSMPDAETIIRENGDEFFTMEEYLTFSELDRREKERAQKEKQAEEEKTPPPARMIEDAPYDFFEGKPAWMKRTYDKVWTNGVLAVYLKIDKYLSPYTSKAVEKLRRRFPTPTRSKANPLLDRLFMLLGAGAVVAAVVALIIFISSLFPQNIRGEWMVSDQFSVEFRRDKTVVSWVYVDGKPHVEREGVYSVKKKNGYNLLTITFEDGTQRRLYYEIRDDVGKFTNVDTNMEAEYTRR